MSRIQRLVWLTLLAATAGAPELSLTASGRHPFTSYPDVYVPDRSGAEIGPRIWLWPPRFEELHVGTTGDSTVFLYVSNTGDTELTFQVAVTGDDDGRAHVRVNGDTLYASAIPAGAPAQAVAVNFDGLGLSDPSVWNWRLEVTSNDPDNDPAAGGIAYYIDLEVYVTDTWYTCQSDTLSTGLHRMQVSSCLEMGSLGAPGTGFFNYVDSANWLYSGSPVITLVTAGGDTVAYHNAFMTPSDRTRAHNKSFRAQSEMLVTRDTTIEITNGDTTLVYVADIAEGRASSTDTTIGIDYEVGFYKNPETARGAVWRFKMYNLVGAPIAGIHYGAVADFDLDPAGSENGGSANERKGWIGAVGGVADTVLGFLPNHNYMALFHLPLDTHCCEDGARAAQVLANSAYVFPEDGFVVDSLYTLFLQHGQIATWSAHIRGDTGAGYGDISVMLVTGYNLTLGVGDTVEWGYGLAATDIGTAELEETVWNLRRVANRLYCVPDGCPLTLSGDVNADGALTAADIIVLVNWIFKAIGEPVPCPGAGDVNCDGAPTAADIIYQVGRVFKDKAPWCDPCDTPMGCRPGC